MKDQDHANSRQPVTLKSSLIDFWKRTFDYSGVTKFGKYWHLVIVDLIVYFLALILALTLAPSYGTKVTLIPIGVIVTLFFGIPFISLDVRRLRDVGFSNLGILSLFIALMILGLVHDFYDSLSSNVVYGVIGIIMFYISFRPTDNYVSAHKNDWGSKFFRQKR